MTGVGASTLRTVLSEAAAKVVALRLRFCSVVVCGAARSLMRGSAGAAVTVGALLARVSDVFSYDAPMVSYVYVWRAIDVCV